RPRRAGHRRKQPQEKRAKRSERGVGEVAGIDKTENGAEDGSTTTGAVLVCGGLAFFSPLPRPRGRGVGGEGAAQPPHSPPLSPEAGERGAKPTGPPESITAPMTLGVVKIERHWVQVAGRLNADLPDRKRDCLAHPVRRAPVNDFATRSGN